MSADVRYIARNGQFTIVLKLDRGSRYLLQVIPINPMMGKGFESYIANSKPH